MAVSFCANAEESKAPASKPAETKEAAAKEAAVKPAKKLYADSFLGKKAPELKVEKWITAEPDTKGKFVLIDFWATWCPPCRAAVPHLNEFQEKFRDKLVVIGISDEAETKVKPFTEKEIKYSSAIDTAATTKKAVNVQGIPHVMIVNPKGMVVWEGFPFESGYELTEEVVKGLLEAK